ncbi:TPA: hypothetical protein ACGUPM_002668 [Vibrio vulnificus]
MKRLSRIRLVIIASGLAIVLAGCQSLPVPSPATDFYSCKPTPPQLEWYEVEEGGVYYPKRAFTNLQLYIEDLNDCIDYYQANPG